MTLSSQASAQQFLDTNIAGRNLEEQIFDMDQLVADINAEVDELGVEE